MLLTALGDQQNVFDPAMPARVVCLVLAAEVRRTSVVGICFTDASWRLSSELRRFLQVLHQLTPAIEVNATVQQTRWHCLIVRL